MQTPKSTSSQFPILLGASALIVLGLLRRSKAGTALAAGGAALAWKGLQENSPSTFTARARFRVNTSLEEAYKLWRDTPGLIRFQSFVKSIEDLGGNRSRWTLQTPVSSLLPHSSEPLGWTSELTDDQPNRRIAWRSLEGSSIHTTGFVELEEDPLGRGIFVTTESTFNVPSNPVARALYSLLGRNPTFVARESLRKFKSFVEAGEIPTVEGQPHGPRHLKGQIQRGLYRETSNPSGPQVDAPVGAAASRESAAARSDNERQLQPA